MNNENTFHYTYSASENQEVLNIRKKYLPREESKLEELLRLDRTVQNAGALESLCAGIGGCMVFGIGMCLAMGIIGQFKWLGIAVGLIGVFGMLMAFPIHRKFFTKARQQYAPRILELTEQITGQN